MNRIAGLLERESKNKSATSYGSVDWGSEAAAVAFATERWESRQRRLGHLERQWYINVSFYLGQQWITWDATARTVRSSQAPPWRVRLTINLVQGVARKIVAKILSAKPIWAVSPATGDYEDIERARIGEKVGRGYWSGRLKMDQKLYKALNWSSVCGTGALRLFWDASAGDPIEGDLEDIEDDDDRRKMKKKAGKKAKKGKFTVNMGDASVESVPPFAIDPDPSATGPEDMTHIIHSRLRSKAWVEAHYPDKAGKVRYGNAEHRDYYERRLADASGPQAFETALGSTSDPSVNEDSAVVHDIWGLDIPGHPSGVHAVVAGDTLLVKEKNNYRYDGAVALPFAIFREIEVPGRFWGTCALEQALGLQSNLNASRSQLVENRNMMARPKWMVPRGANIGDDALTSEPGEVVEHTPGLEPKPSVPPPLPPYVIREMDQTRQDFQDVTNLHEVSNAQAPANVRSGVAIAQLQEQDTTVLIPTIQSIEYELGKLGSMLLEMLSREVSEERLVKIVGEETSVDFQTFTGKDLSGESEGANYFDVHVQMGSQLGLSKDAQRNFLLQIAQMFPDLFAGEHAQKKLLELIDVGTSEPLYNNMRLDIANANMENRKMLDGVMPIVHPSDDDEAHIAEHERYQKTPEYRRRIAEDIQLDAMFVAHVTQHKEELAASQPAPPQPQPPPGLPQQALPQQALAPAPIQTNPQVSPEALAPPPADINEAIVREILSGQL